VSGYAPRAPEDSMRPRRLSGAPGRPLNFTVRIQETPMLVLLKFIATFAAAMFGDAALYVNVAEHPARMTLDTRFAAAQWAPSYRRATWMQAPLALLSLVASQWTRLRAAAQAHR
jgi:hypothetical protein